MKTRTSSSLVFFAFFLFILGSLGGRSVEAVALAPGEAERIIGTIRQQWLRQYAAQQGTVSHRRTETKWFHAGTGKLRETTVALQEYSQFFYRKPEVTTSSCTLDGQPAANKRCDDPWKEGNPPHPVFDREGAQHYDVRVVGQATIDGHPCYRIEVVPLQQTNKHFVGTMYFRTQNLQLLMIEGSFARLPFAVRHLYMKVYYRKVGKDLVDAVRGYVDVWVRVPLLYKRRIISQFTADAHRPIPFSR